jgi:hypothetical protein
MRVNRSWWALAALCAASTLVEPPAGAQAPPPVAAPLLKWQAGGCAGFCEPYWYASPAVADFDGDGQPEVVGAADDLVVLDGDSGLTRARDSGGTRVWADVAVADLEGDQTLEVVFARGTQVHAYRPTVTSGVMTLNVPPGWPASPLAAGDIRSLALADLEGDGTHETIAARTGSGSASLIAVLTPAAVLRAGWPAIHPGDPGFGTGIYNNGLAVADMDENGAREIYAAPDFRYLLSFRPDGTQRAAHPMYGDPKVWSEVAVHVDHAVDLRGYVEDCATEHPASFLHTAPAVADLDGDGTLELVAPAGAFDCDIGSYLGDYATLPWVFRHDRTRWAGGPFDWTAIPVPGPGSAPQTTNQEVIWEVMPNAVPADLDGDGQREILHASYDGKVHAWWLDKTQHGNWPYDVPGTGIRYASPPVVADLNGDGAAEVIFTSWGETGTTVTNDLHVLDAMGNPLHALTLPAGPGASGSTGAMASPTLANIDGDANLELVIATHGGGLVAYDLPGTASARVRWGTGRGGFARAGEAPEQIFADGFDLGGLARWSSASTDGGDLSATPAASLSGAGMGLQAAVDDTAGLYVQDDEPNNENRYRARFRLDPNGFDPGETAGKRRTRVLILFEQAPTRRLAAVVLRRLGGQYSLQARVRRDDDTQADTGFITITDAPHTIELDWRRATSPIAGNGRLDLWIDGVLRSTLTGLDNNASSVDFVRLGALSVKATATGTLFLDGFESRRRTYIGP